VERRGGVRTAIGHRALTARDGMASSGASWDEVWLGQWHENQRG
jgi:hypothetical protein